MLTSGLQGPKKRALLCESLISKHHNATKKEQDILIRY